MRHLAHRDARAVADFLRVAYGALEPRDFAVEATRALRRLVPADRASYNELYRKRAVLAFVEPDGSELRGSLWQALARHGHESPILSHYRRTGRADVVSFSDFASRAQFHRLALYNEYYRHVEVEHQVIVPLTLSTVAHEIGFALSRRRPDFSARERSVLELVRPHLLEAHAQARSVARLRAQHAWLEGALEAAGAAVVVLGEGGRIAFGTRRIQALLADYFGAGAGADRLPDALLRWVRHAEAPRAAEDRVPRPRAPLVVSREGRRLSVRLVSAQGRRMLLLEERHVRLDPEALAPLGLTRREREVLAWIAMGKANDEIASIVGARASTIAKHLEHIYQKLGVESRTAAAVLALSTAGVALGPEAGPAR